MFHTSGEAPRPTGGAQRHYSFAREREIDRETESDAYIVLEESNKFVNQLTFPPSLRVAKKATFFISSSTTLYYSIVLVRGST